MYDVLIDACPGATIRSRVGSPQREDVALRIARRVSAMLGPGSALTRSSETSLPPAERAKMAKKSGARAFLSLHARSNGGRKRPNATWVHSRANAASRRLAGAIQGSLAAERFGSPDERVGSADVAVLAPDWLGDTPACLLDLDVDDQRLDEDGLPQEGEWLERLARAIARAIKDFLHMHLRRHHREDDDDGGDPYGRMGRRWVYGDAEGSCRVGPLLVTSDSSQQDQADEVRHNIAKSLSRWEGHFDSVHRDSNRWNFGIGSWTGARIGDVLDMYVTVATENGTTDTLYGYFAGGQTTYEDISSRFRSQGVTGTLSTQEVQSLQNLGRDNALQDAQIRVLAGDVQHDLDAVGGHLNPSYPWIDSYMDAISELAAHVLVHATHQSGRTGVWNRVGAVIGAHGGEAQLGQEMVNGTTTEQQFLREVGDQVIAHSPAADQAGVRNRYNDLFNTYASSTLSYYFHPR